MFLACIFSSKIVATEEMRLFFFAFSEGGNERKKVRLSLKNTNPDTHVFIQYSRTQNTHTERENTAAFAAFRENLREF